MASGVYLEKPIQVDNWNNYIMLGIGDLFRSQELCDLTLRFPSRDLKAHSVVLHSCSSFFTSLLKGKTVGHKIIKMPPQIDADAMAALLTFIYTGRLQCALDLSVLHATARVVKLNVLVTLLEAQMSSDPSGFYRNHQLKSSPVSTENQRTGRQWNRLKCAPSSVSRTNSRQDRHRANKSHKISKPKFVDPPAVLRPSRFEYPADLPAIHLPSPSALDTGDTPSETPLVDGVPATTSRPPVRANGVENSSCIDCDVGECVQAMTVASAVVPLPAESEIGGDCGRITPAAGVVNSTSASAGAGGEVMVENVAAEVEVSCSGVLAGNTSATVSDKSANIKPTTSKQTLLECSLCASQSHTTSPRLVEAADMPLHLEREHSTALLPPECRQCTVSPSVAATENDNNSTVPITIAKCSSPVPLHFSSVLDYIKHVENVHIVCASSLSSSVSTDARPQNTCSVCGYGASTWLNLAYHRYTRHRAAPPAYVHFPRCDRCEFEAISPSQLDTHLQRRHRALRRYRCRQCPPAVAAPSFDTPSQLEGHRRTCHGAGAASRRDNIWKCQLCGLAFSRSYNLKAHMRSVHRGSNSSAPLLGAGVCVLTDTGTASAIGRDQAGQILAGDQLTALRYTTSALFQTDSHSTEVADSSASSQPVSLLNAISAAELAQHLQQQSQHHMEPMACEFILSSDVASATGESGGSVIPVQDENGVVSYITLQPASASVAQAAGAPELAAGPDGSALLEISQLPPPVLSPPPAESGGNQSEHVHLQHQELYQMSAPVQSCDGALMMPDAVVMTTTVQSSVSTDAAVPVSMTTGHVATSCGIAPEQANMLTTCGPMSCVQNSCASSLIDPERSVYDALPAASTIEQTISAQQLSANGRCFIDSSAQRPSDATDDWSQMMPSVLMVTNESQPRV